MNSMNNINNMKIILASASPRRRELLKQIGLEYEVLVSDAKEVITSTEPSLVVEELARQKAENVFAKYFAAGDSEQDILIISADTIVACDGQILGKPRDAEDGAAMLRMLQGRAHEVYTGVCLLYCKQGAVNYGEHSFHEATRVHFYPMSEEEIAYYIAPGDFGQKKDSMAWANGAVSPEWSDKAGGYGIQGLCARYISGIEGDYNNVVGLPVGRLYQEMKAFL